VKLGRGITSFRGQPKPFRGLDIVLRNAVAVSVCQPKIELGDCQTLIRSLAQPRGRLGIIPLHTQASGVHLPEVELGERITPVGKGTQYSVRGGVIAFADSGSSVIEWARGCARSEAQHENEGAEDRRPQGPHLR
jgi:hypothetical protein